MDSRFYLIERGVAWRSVADEHESLDAGERLQAARDFEEETWIHPEKQDDGAWGTEVFFPKQGYRLSGGGGRATRVRGRRDVA